MDYKINSWHASYIVSTAISDGSSTSNRHILVARSNEQTEPDFYYLGADIDEAVLSIEEDVGRIEGLREHIKENWDKPGRVNWSDETLLLDDALVYVVKFAPLVEAESEVREILCDDLEEAYSLTKDANFVCGGSVSLMTMTQVTLIERQMGNDAQEYVHPQFDELRHLEADRRSYQIPVEDGAELPAPRISI